MSSERMRIEKILTFKMPFLLKLLIIVVLVFISPKYEAAYAPPDTLMVFPITKHTDAAKPLYSVQIITDYVDTQLPFQNFLIDIDAPFTWHDCIVQWNIHPGSCPKDVLCESPVSCEDYECTDVQTSYSYQNPSCPPDSNSSTLPGWGFCSCPVNVVDPVTGTCGQALLNYDYITTNAACVPSSSFGSFPANVTGVVAFSNSRYAYPEYLAQAVKRSLSLCLPSSTSSRGVLFFGSGPYYLPSQSNVDVRSYLSYTHLLKHPNYFGYFLGVVGIVIKKRSIIIPADTSTKLSTIDPYTTLRSDIYNGIIRRFSRVTKRIPSAKPIAPFGLCFNTSTNGTQVGLKVPNIDFSLQNGKKWTISTANSIKQITKDVSCLAFVDGGATSEPAIVIGTFQFEDNFLLFDLENSTFGFSSSLLLKQTSCSNYNFTLTNSP